MGSNSRRGVRRSGSVAESSLAGSSRGSFTRTWNSDEDEENNNGKEQQPRPLELDQNLNGIASGEFDFIKKQTQRLRKQTQGRKRQPRRNSTSSTHTTEAEKDPKERRLSVELAC